MIRNDSSLSVEKDIIIYCRCFNFMSIIPEQVGYFAKKWFTWLTQFMVNIDLFCLKSSS